MCVFLPQVYSSLSEGEFQLLRQTLLIFFQDMNVRVSCAQPSCKDEDTQPLLTCRQTAAFSSFQVSLFLKSQVQNPNGRFAMPQSGPVPHGTDVPGLIRSRADVGKRENWQPEHQPVSSNAKI